MIFDIHTHILPAVDDGAEDINESLELLAMMKAQGITDCIATPHFYPESDNLSGFINRISTAFKQLQEAISNKDLPNIYLGSEVLYFEGIGYSRSISKLCLNGCPVLLLELTDESITEKLFEDLLIIKNNMGITPIIAHIERYHNAKKYRSFLKFLKANKIPTQINAASLFIPEYKRAIKKLITSGLAYVIATDTHSVNERPPRLDDALALIEKNYGKSHRIRLVRNSQILYEKIVSEDTFYA